MSASARASRQGGLPGIYRAEVKYELLKTLRQPSYVIPTLAFPLLFYVMFGLVLGGRQTAGGVHLATYFLATYATFGVMGAALFGFGAGVAMERGYGWLQVKRASPMPPLAYLVAKVAMSMLFSALVVLLLVGVGILFGGVRLAPLVLLRLLGVLIVGTLPFCALGLLIGCWTAPNAAPGVVNLLFLPMSFCSGLWLPLGLLPRFLQHLAPFLPAYHLGQLALRTVGLRDTGAAGTHVLALLVFTVIFLGFALRGFNRDDVNVNP